MPTAQLNLFAQKGEVETLDPKTLPAGWKWVKLSEVNSTISDGDHQAPPKATSGVPFIVISNIIDNRPDFTTTRYVPRSYYDELKENRKPKPGDLLYTVTGSYGIPALVDGQQEFCFQRHIALLRPNQLINRSFLFYCLLSPDVYNQATAVATGTAQLTVPLSGLRNILIPLPPLAEQLRLVGRIEELFSEIDAGVREAEAALGKLKTYRQAVLHHYLSNGDWERVRIGDVIKTINNGYTPKNDKMSDGAGDVQFLKVYNLTHNGSLNHTKNPVFISRETHEKELKRSITYPGDVLINIVGPPLGKVSLVPPIANEFNINQAVVLFRPNERVDGHFLSYFLQSPKTVSWLESTSNTTAGQHNIKVSTCREIMFPLVSMEEQTRIVAEIESRLSEADALEVVLKQTLVRAGRLRQSVLGRAFGGEL